MDYSVFGSIPVPKKGRTNFDEGHSVSGTFPLSKVCPVCFIDSIPGSSWNINVHNLTKLETLISPAMQRIDASILWFKMPKRLLFKYFKKWYSGGEDGQDSHQKPHIHIYDLRNSIITALSNASEASIQKFTEEIFGPGSLWNYMGLPCPLWYDTSTGVWKVRSINDWDDESDVGDPDSDFVDMMPLMAYCYIYDAYFRDQTLNDSFFVDAEEQDFTINRGFVFTNSAGTTYYFGPEAKDPGAYRHFYTSGNNLFEGGELNWVDALCILQLFNRAWRKDYFTSALPSPQRGPEVTLSLVGDAPVTLGSNGVDGTITTPTMETNGPVIDQALSIDTDSAPSSVIEAGSGQVTRINGIISAPGLKGTADLSGLSPISIIAFRNLFKLQSFLEKNNVSGGRYIESILAHWGERVPDFTVQRPQFVRATSLPVQISEVTATANSSGTSSIVGDQAGRARTQGNLGRVHIYTQEPSFIFGLYCVTAPPSYAGQGLPKIFQHVTRFDEPWTEFQHIGEQAIKARELFFPFNDADAKDLDFGYQQRYSEYKFMPDRVVGDFQTSLSYWHMARMFNSMPYLNGDFVTQNLDPRIFAVQSGRPVTADFYFDIRAKLKLSKYSTPKIS